MSPAQALTTVFLVFLAMGLIGLFIVFTDEGLRWKKIILLFSLYSYT